jgi:hypothetical protein
VTARIGVVAAVASLTLALPATSLAAPRVVASKSVGDHCLVGTWRARPAVVSIRFHHKNVRMHYGGGDYMHITRHGDVVDNFAQSRVLQAFPGGFELKMHIRGVLHQHYRGLDGTSDSKGRELHVLRATSRYWGSGSYIRATYAGKPVKFRFKQLHDFFGGYTCSNTAFIEIDRTLSVQQTYSRRSFTP